MNRESFIAEQLKRAQEGNRSLGRVILETAAGSNSHEYAKETMRLLDNKLGQHVNYVALSAQGDGRSYIRLIDGAIPWASADSIIRRCAACTGPYGRRTFANQPRAAIQ